MRVVHEKNDSCSVDGMVLCQNFAVIYLGFECLHS